MNLLHYALPGLLLLFFLWRSLRQRIFLLGIPFLMYMSNSVFFENAKPFWMPGRLSPSDHVMLWLVIVWLLSFDLLLPLSQRKERRPQVFGPALSFPEELVLVGIAVLAGFEVILTVLRFSQAGASLSEAKGFIYLFAGYFLLRGMFCRASRADTLAFLKALVVVNTIAAALFIVHQGLHITVYSVTEYQTLTFMGERITRSFYFMPQLLTLALAYTFAKRRWSIFWIGVIVVTLGALWVSYTRSLLIIALVELVAILGARLFKGQQAGLVVKRALTIVVLAAVLGVVAWVALPVQSQYFVSRISAATSSGSLTGDPNLQNRENKIRRTYEWIADSGHLVGQGFVTASQDFHVAEIEVMSSDLVWVPVLYRLGLIGVVLVMLLYLAGGWRAAKLSMAEDPDAEFLGLVLFGLMVGTFLEGAVSWTFLNPARYPMGFWVFALLAAEACRRRAERAAEVAGVEAGGSAAGPGMGIAARPPRGGSHA